jgi:hypothetical protein
MPTITNGGLYAFDDGSIVTRPYTAIGQAPVTALKTVGTTAGEVFAGGSRLASRYSMTVYNESNTTIYWGATGVTTSNGFPLLAGDSVTFTFKANIATAIYFVAGANSNVRVVELA